MEIIKIRLLIQDLLKVRCLKHMAPIVLKKNFKNLKFTNLAFGLKKTVTV